MKKLAMFLAGSALAATTAVAGSNFNGPFIGAHIGVGNADMGTSASAFSNAQAAAAPFIALNGDGNLISMNGDMSALGVIGGLHAGWDKVFNGKWLLGIELTGDLSSASGDFQATGPNARNAANNGFLAGDNIKVDADMDWAIGVNVRAGAIIHDCLVYLALGWMGADWEMKTTYTPRQIRVDAAGAPNAAGAVNATFATRSHKKDKFKSGFRLALGTSMMVNEHLMAGVEAAYTWFGSLSDTRVVSGVRVDGNTANGRFDNVTVRSKIEPELLTAKFKLSWKFKRAA
ncbi:MAG: hypothetical protein ACPGXY_04285 [Alphaproteobacteria bacterium]